MIMEVKLAEGPPFKVFLFRICYILRSKHRKENVILIKLIEQIQKREKGMDCQMIITVKACIVSFKKEEAFHVAYF